MSQNNKDFLSYYGQFKDKIFTYFWYRVNFNRHLAEDLAADVFLKAYSHFDSFESGRPFQPWIYAIARNHLINHYRQANREISLEQIYDLGDNNNIERLKATLELKEVIKTINTKLDPKTRDVLIYKFVDGLSNEEIADVLGKEEGAVRTQISRGLSKLKEFLSYDGYRETT